MPFIRRKSRKNYSGWFIKDDTDLAKLAILNRDNNRRNDDGDGLDESDRQSPNEDIFGASSVIGFYRGLDRNRLDNNGSMVPHSLVKYGSTPPTTASKPDINLAPAGSFRDIAMRLGQGVEDLTVALQIDYSAEDATDLDGKNQKPAINEEATGLIPAQESDDKDCQPLLDEETKTEEILSDSGFRNYQKLQDVGQEIGIAFDKLQTTSVNLIALFKLWRAGEFLNYDRFEEDEPGTPESSETALRYIKKNFSFEEIKQSAHCRLHKSVENLSDKISQAIELLEQGRQSREDSIGSDCDGSTEALYSRRQKEREIRQIDDLLKLLSERMAIMRFLLKDNPDEDLFEESEPDLAPTTKGGLVRKVDGKRRQLLEKLLSAVAVSYDPSPQKTQDLTENERLARIFGYKSKTMLLTKLKQDIGESVAFIDSLLDRAFKYTTPKTKTAGYRGESASKTDRNIGQKSSQPKVKGFDGSDSSALPEPSYLSKILTTLGFSEERRPPRSPDERDQIGSDRGYVEQLRMILNGEAPENYY